MSKRSSEFSDIEKNKKIKTLTENIDIENHEVSIFLLIFNQLSINMGPEETFEETDGIITDTISVICNLLTDLLKNNIDNLSIPKPLKTTLKVLKRIFKIMNEKQLIKDAEDSCRSETTAEEETSEASGERGEEQRQDSSEK